MKKTVHVRWTGKRQFVGTDETKHSVVMSSADEENRTGMNPSQLLLISLGGCTSYDVVEILEKKRQALSGLAVTITGEQNSELPRPFRKIDIHFTLTGKNLNEKAVRDAIALSEEKYCSVAATLSGKAAITTGFTIKEAE